MSRHTTSQKAGRKAGARRLAALAGAACLALGGAAYGGTVGGPVIISTDADTGIDPAATTYTHALDFIADGSAANINGLQFEAAGRDGVNYTTTNLNGEINESQFNLGGAGTGAAPGSGLDKLLLDFYWNSDLSATGQAETVTLTGLTEGTAYTLRMFYRQWDANEANTRFTDITFNEETGSGFIRVNQDESENARMITYDYVAGPSGTLNISFAEGGNSPLASWHQYGLSNEVLIPEPASLGLLSLGALGLLARRRRA